VTFEEVRARYPVCGNVAYLNAGTFGPLSRATAEAIARCDEQALLAGRSGKPFFDETMAGRQALREKIGKLVSVPPEHVSLTGSTTDGCNIVLAGLGLGPEDEVVTTTDEHFGLLGPLGASRARIVVVSPDPDQILAAVTPRTRLVALSHVLWTTGDVLPVAELREQAGVPFLVDGAQSVGAIEVDASPFEFYTVSGQKWLCGPDSTGALVVSDPERLPVARPSFLSQASYGPDGAFAPRPGAARFDPGWLSPGAVAGLVTALSERPPWAFSRAEDHAASLRGLLAPHVEVRSHEPSGPLVSFRPDGGLGAADLVERLRLAGVIVREVPGRGLVRASVGFWNDERDLERLVETVAT
jgi:L-cysteine/cystine lyase